MGVGSRAMTFKDNGSIQVDILLPLQPDDFLIEDNLSFNMGWAAMLQYPIGSMGLVYVATFTFG